MDTYLYELDCGHSQSRFSKPTSKNLRIGFYCRVCGKVRFVTNYKKED